MFGIPKHRLLDRGNRPWTDSRAAVGPTGDIDATARYPEMRRWDRAIASSIPSPPPLTRSLRTNSGLAGMPSVSRSEQWGAGRSLRDRSSRDSRRTPRDGGLDGGQADLLIEAEPEDRKGRDLTLADHHSCLRVDDDLLP